MPAPEVDSALLAARLAQGLDALGLVLDAPCQSALLAYLILLNQWNRQRNLTAVREPLAMVERHLLDSLAASAWFTRGPVLDLGSGAGLPGLPLAIAHPELRFVLLDSAGKKVRFLTQVAAQLRLANVTTVQARVMAYRPVEKFAMITARALASLPELWDMSAHLRATGACLLAYKGRLPETEIATLSTRGAWVRAHRLRVPWLAAERHLIEVRCRSASEI